MVCVKERETKMKGMKEEDKHFDPLFPRININEAERGGPRAPPRNKMALCEQLTLPSSHEFNSGSMSMLPLPPPSTSSNFTSSSPPSHVSMGMFSLYSSGNGHHPHSSNSSLMAPDFRSLMPLSYQSTVQWLPTSEHNMLQPHCFVNPRNITAEKYRAPVNNVRLPNFTRLGKIGEFKIVKEEGTSENRVEKSTCAQPSNENMCRDTNGVFSRMLVRDTPKNVEAKNRENNFTRPKTLPDLRKRSASVMEGLSRSMEEVGYINNVSNRPKSTDCGSEAGGTSDKSDSMSNETEGKSIANFVVTPKEVIRAIGQERFWNARKTILDQQRILAAQLFDLHRLVKVQRLMAESPEMIFEDNFYLRKPSIKLQNPRKLFAETNEDVKANLQESNFKIENMPESVNKKLPPIPCPSITNDTKSSPLLFHPPPGNQWLVPVRSPSEGLIYKPYTGPLPPTAGILSPFYDQSFLNTAYNLPASNLLGHSYLQPYPLPSLNASGSTSTFEPTSKFIKHPIPDQDSSIQPYKNGIVSECSKLPDGRKENDLQDSTETSPLVRNKVDILSLFPTTPSHRPPLSSSASEQKIQAIKVVPHSRKSASESAARIFETIQEERKKHG